MLIGAIAAQLFKRIWGAITDREPADPEQRDAGWPEVLGSAAISGAIFAFVRALVRRAGAKGFEHATGVWPGDETADEA